MPTPGSKGRFQEARSKRAGIRAGLVGPDAVTDARQSMDTDGPQGRDTLAFDSMRRGNERAGLDFTQPLSRFVLG